MKTIYSFLFIVFLISGYAQITNCQSHKSGAMASSIYYSPENLRSDTFDILKYTINLNITDFANQKISGHTIVRFAPKLNAQSKLSLDLLKMVIDSVKQASTLLTYVYNDTLLKITLPSTMNIIDTADVYIYYHGTPQGDPSGWGGFSFSGNYAYNLGVGFGAKPHNYGRVWFPCFDNFVEKSIYEFNITTVLAKTSFCNGALMSDITNGGLHTRKWVLNKEIPSYLASVAVADYTQVNWSIAAANGNLPVTLAARASDTIGLKNGFIHLPNAVLGFENYYGPYVWNRVGYCLVPFNSGAMEHATNISYPQAATSIVYESQLMAHELSHHWWGDLMTCETQEDMWLNEGMASYSERMFLEWTYNYGKYIAEVKSIHDDIVKYIHLREKGFRAISGVPHQYTYGDHVYKKGADVAHTLRSYMGDAAFFAGLKYVMQQKAFKNMNSIEFRDLLAASSGQNLNDFFDNWVLNGGWPHFSIDSVNTTGSGSPYTSVIYVKQKLFGAPALFSNVPLEVSFMDASWNKEVKTLNMTGAAKSFTIQTNVMPVYAGMNVESKISDAVSSEVKIIKTNTTLNYTLGRATVFVLNKGVDSSYVRIEHNFAAPDPFQNNPYNFRLNSQHYWKVDGILSSGFVGKLRFNYDGTKTMSGNSYLDTCLTIVNGDSIILLYRKNAGDDWKEVNSYTKIKIGSKTGLLTADTLKFGEYVFANGHSNILTSVKNQKQLMALNVFPNPASGVITVTIDNYKIKNSFHFIIYDMQGKPVKQIDKINQSTEIDISNMSRGSYVINMIENSQTLSSKIFIVD
ncbi:MAG: M1 family aminopeptidase [Bacteroidota bacterium]